MSDLRIDASLRVVPFWAASWPQDEGDLAPHPSRWLRLVKWLLAIPRAIVLLCV